MGSIENGYSPFQISYNYRYRNIFKKFKKINLPSKIKNRFNREINLIRENILVDIKM